MLERITPLILTFNEAPNIDRVLSRLRWARRIVVVDSGSNDGTLEIIAEHANAEVISRKFDEHAAQWNFGLETVGSDTEWVLAIDADYVLSDELVRELGSLNPGDDVVGYRAHFLYCVQGKAIRSGTYPPVIVLYRRNHARYLQDGHTQRLAVEGRIEDLVGKIHHDDRKPLARWLESQRTYAQLEVAHLQRVDRHALKWQDRIRLMVGVAPPCMFLYVYLFRGGFLDGTRGLLYALQRAYAELLLSLVLLDRRLRRPTGE